MDKTPETRPKQSPGETALSEAKLAPVSLPKGGGAIRGMGEKFSVNPATGTGKLEVPIATSPGRQGFGPKLSLSYDSGVGNGTFGAGWSLSVASISRKTDKGLPRYNDHEFGVEADTFLWSGAEDLVPASRKNTADKWELDTRVATENGATYTVRRYLPRTEGSFARIERWDEANGEIHWRVTSRDNTTEIFGRDASGRIADPEDPSKIFSWLVQETRDDRGNIAKFEYVHEDLAGTNPAAPHERNRTGAQPQRHLKRILYGNTTPFSASGFVFEVVFDYGDHSESSPTPTPDRTWPERPDSFSSFRSGFQVRTRRLCKRVLMFHRFAELGTAPVLVRSTSFAYMEAPDLTHLVRVTATGHAPGQPDQSMPALEFEYSAPAMDASVKIADAPDLPEGIDGSRFQWVDLDGDGIPGVLAPHADAWYYAPNLGDGRFGRRRELPSQPTLAKSPSARLVDVSGEGRMALTEFSGTTPGFVERLDPRDAAGPFPEDAKPDWASFRSFPNVPVVDWSSPHVHQIDLDGDGFPDLLITESDAFCWHPSLGRDGYGASRRLPNPGLFDEEKGPRFLIGSATESIHLADLSGDGLADLVRIRNGEVCYWPNLGYGKFGAKVTMDRSPVFDTPDQFSPTRIRIADLDGTGLADILYLESGRVRYWRNLSGNAWSDAVELPAFPKFDNLSSVQVTDFLGTGTACLVWSSPLPGESHAPLRYVDLMGTKSHLLVKTKNNLGAQTRLQYASSTKFFLADREAGKPWATRLPFPVHVVEQSEILETSTGTRMTSRYAYHHGFWDGTEREFRGFAHVQQWDAESWSGSDGDPDQILIRPPVRTETWLHTGAWFVAHSLMARLKTEWFQGDAQAWPLPDCQIPPDLPPEEQREAVRTLRGRMLRQEVYADDGTDKAGFPYSVTEQSHVALLVQPRTTAIPQKHAVFVAHDREKRSSHYEREASDPRIQQELTLAVDEFATPLRTAAIGYPRRSATGPARTEQSTHHITVSTNRVAHQTLSSGPHRIAVPVESRTWELSGLALPTDRPFTFAEIDTAFDAATEMAYEASPAANVQEKRCLETKRVVYYDDSLSDTALPLGQAGSLALPHTTWICAYTPGFLTANYGTRITDADLTAAGYAKFPGDTDGLWWARSARILHDKNRFLLPVGSVDPWGNTSSQSWDSHGLLVEQSTDPLGNTVSVKNHYRTLAPWWITDPNDNHTAARFDALGRVTATFVLGKSTATGYEADFVDAASTEPSATDDPTTTIAYDLATLPVRVQTRARERYRTTVGGATTRWQESWLYTDGLGREILTKVQAEAGEAFAHDSNGDLLRNPDGTPKIQPTTTRWVGTGRKVYDNKGNVVKRYEPYFTDTPAFDSEPELVETGVSAVLHYDPVNRPIRTDLPDGTFTKVEFTPWVQSTHDANDTVLQSDWYTRSIASTDPAVRRAAQLAAAHANTPSVAHLDTLGRVVLIITQSDATTTHTTRNTLDLEGNLLRQDVSRDASTTLTVLTQTFDILGRVCMARHPDSGAKLIWRDIASQTLRSWDEPNTPDERSQRFEYDELRRPVRRWVNGATTYLAEETTYGESLTDAKARNARGQAFSHKDGAGIASDEQRDFQGKVTRSVRQLTTNTTKDVPDWSKAVAVDETFTTLTTYDALGRVIQIDTPHNQSVPASQIYPIYNEANLLDRVEASLRGATTRTTFVQNIDYDAKGQRQRITYGNGATTRYQYDPLTWRLTNLLTTRNSGADTLQNLSYTYDPTGNVVQITDNAQQTVFFNNQVVTATALYEYDALYRLTQSTGREHINNGAATEPEAEGFNTPQNLPSDGQSLRNYTRSWTYDHVGNILSLIHTATNGNWTRKYAYATDSNRLATTTVGSVTQTYTHNAHGSFTAMPHLDAMDWTADERLLHVKRGTSQTWYTYDSTGQRVRKVTEKGGITEERLYLGGWEIYRKRQGTTVVLERETLHLMDGARRIAMVETKTVDLSSTTALPATVTRYQLDNHIQSATLELDETANVISYEEYYPYGDTSYRSARSSTEVSEKRYRYTGKEKDEETGLYYHGARYYAAWLGRWTAADPAGMVDGACLYAYVRNHPTGLVDPDGRAGTSVQDRLTTPRIPPEQIRNLNPLQPSKSVEDLVNQITANGKTMQQESAKQAWNSHVRSQFEHAEGVFGTLPGTTGFLAASLFTKDLDKRLAGGDLGNVAGVLLFSATYARGIKGNRAPDFAPRAKVKLGSPSPGMQADEGALPDYSTRAYPKNGYLAPTKMGQQIENYILSLPKGMRSNPSGYLPGDYQYAHKELFLDGAARIQPTAPSGQIGRTETWVMPLSAAKNVISKSNGNVSTLESLLGLNPGTLGKNPVLVEIPSPTGLRIPTGNEFGANSNWRPGGQTFPGKIPEAIINPVAPGSYTYKPVF